jgi:hypothetical protein
MYYLFNKEENRVVVENDMVCGLTLSGELGNKSVYSVNPIEYTYWKAKLASLPHEFKTIKVKTIPIQSLDCSFINGSTYAWLQQCGNNTLYKVTYGENSSKNYVEGDTVSLSLKDGRVNLPLADFNIIVF